MGHPSEPRLLVLHTVRLKGIADTPEIADHTGLDTRSVEEQLDAAASAAEVQRLADRIAALNRGTARTSPPSEQASKKKATKKKRAPRKKKPSGQPKTQEGEPRPLLLFAHGAGAPSTSAWMQRWTALLGEIGHVVPFDYPYAHEGRKRPDRAPMLLAAHREALEQARRGHDGRLPGHVQGPRRAAA